MAETAWRMLQFSSQNGKHCICELPPGGLYGQCKCYIVRSLETPIGDNWTLSITLCLWQHNWDNVKVGAFRSGWVNLQRNVCLTVNSYVFRQHSCNIRQASDFSAILLLNVVTQGNFIAALHQRKSVLLSKAAKSIFCATVWRDLGVTYALYLYLVGTWNLESTWSTFLNIIENFQLSLTAQELWAKVSPFRRFVKG